MSAPITDPFFGAPNPNPPAPNDGMYQQQQNNFAPQPFGSPPTMMSSQPANNFYQPQQPQAAAAQPAGINYNNFQTTFAVQTSQQQQQPLQTTSPPPQAQTAVAKPKIPLPEEFIYMQTVFEELKSQCTSAASNPVSLRGSLD